MKYGLKHPVTKVKRSNATPIAETAIYPKFHRNLGFTLVEVLMVVLVISVLTGLIMGIAGLANKKAAQSRAESELQLLANEFEDYRLDKGIYPDAASSWETYNESRAYTNLTSRYTDENVIADIPDFDPWGNSYQYKIPNQQGYQLELRSVGPDGRTGNDYDADNVEL